MDTQSSSSLLSLSLTISLVEQLSRVSLNCYSITPTREVNHNSREERKLEATFLSPFRRPSIKKGPACYCIIFFLGEKVRATGVALWTSMPTYLEVVLLAYGVRGCSVLARRSVLNLSSFSVLWFMSGRSENEKSFLAH